MVVDLGISPYGHTLHRSESRVLRTIYAVSYFFKIASGRQKSVAFEKGGIRLYKPCTREIVRSAPKVASESKFLAWRDHLEQYFINSQISSKSQILDEFNQTITFPSLRPHDKNLDPARTFAVRRLRGSPLACTLA